ncbi:protoporphyrinogen oxidase [Hazenella sp. IB182353]|uniref:protoporphyrinogen oxidase n=1 Tax=Polycladospora coralii TaxID=2771432 RepID=UPI0017477FD5|nr:protoporphyrinogen oxidase [Polycladospora coralii]MBS7530528.1 protoporphyrinogen oxidase [Polycladospora coralii]
MTRSKRHIVLVGGGITGLSTAYYLQAEIRKQNLPYQITLLESSHRLGGKIETIYRDGFVMERGPDSFLERKPSAKQLAVDLGLEEELVRNETGQAYILHHNKLEPIPDGAVMGVPTKLTPFARTGLISLLGKARAAADLLLPRVKQNHEQDQSVGYYFRNRLGDEVVDHIIEPLLSGVYAGNIDKMSLQTTFPQFAELGRQNRSLILGMKKMRPAKPSSEKAKGIFFTLKRGLGSLIDALETQLTDVHIQTGVSVQQITKKEEEYLLTLHNGDTLTADALVMTTPYPIAKNILNEVKSLQPLPLPATSVATVIFAFPQEAVTLSKPGTGFLIPKTEDYQITACTWTHLKWPHTTPAGKVLIRCYVGRAGDQAIVEQPDEVIQNIALQDMRRIFPITSGPEFAYVTRWHHAMSQFAVGHLEWLARTRHTLTTQYPGVFLAGSSYAGSGIPDCIDQGKQAVQDVLDYL